MEFKIAVICGDEFGTEVINAAVGCLDAVSAKYGHVFKYTFPLLGGAAIDATGVPLPAETITACTSAQAVLSGGVGGAKWDNLAFHLRPEKGLLNLKNAMGLYANVLPILSNENLKANSPLRPDIIKQGIDCVIVREISGGIYNNAHGYRDGSHGQEAFDTEVYSIMEIERIAKLAFDIATNRRKKLTSVDKSNYLESGRLWRATVSKIAKSYPNVTVQHLLYEDITAMLLTAPNSVDVILCPNMLGEQLSAQAAAVTGAKLILPSASLGAGMPGFYESAHGCAAENIVNPIGTILAAAIMLSTSLGLNEETKCLENAVRAVLNRGYRTADTATVGTRKVDCAKMGELIALEVFNAK